MKNLAVVLTWGCSHNQKDSQLIEQQLINGGYSLVSEDKLDDADVVVLNTCTVKTPTEDKIFHVLDNLKESKQTIVVAGCISQAEPKRIQSKYPNFIVLGVNAAIHILPALKKSNKSNGKGIFLPMLEHGKKFQKLKWVDKPQLESTRWNKFRHIVQINEGCVNSCGFCATKNARGQLHSFSRESIISSIRKNIAEELWLTSQDTACWGFDTKDNLAGLLRDIDKIERKFWVRVGMGNPNNFIKILDEVIEAFTSDKIYKFLHLPFQAGNNEVLKHMRRRYTIEEYEHIVSEFRKAIPEITLSTDVICGYPTEKAKDFEDTIDAIKTTKPSITNISRYWERKNTPAAGLKQLPFEERKRRSTELAILCKKIQEINNQKWVGWKGEVLFIDKGPKGGIEARNLAYKPIIVNTDANTLGSWRRITITDSTSTYFRGKIISE